MIKEVLAGIYQNVTVNDKSDFNYLGSRRLRQITTGPDVCTLKIKNSVTAK